MGWNLVIVILAVGVYCLTSDFFKKVNPVSYRVSLPEKFSGGLVPNELLDKAEHLHADALHWAESFAEYKGKLYTGLGDGRIVRITNKEVVPILRTGETCEGQHEEHICGRPLGLTFNKAGQLFVADAYLGLLSIDINTGKKSTFCHQKLYIIEHDTSGRLLKYNLKTKEVSVVLKDLAFANGVVLTHDGNALLVAEGSNNKVFKYQIAGETKGYLDFPLVLPGEPDNIKRSKNGNYWISVATGRTLDNPSILDRISDKPFWRSLFLHIHKLSTLPICSIMRLIPHKKVKEIGFELQNARIIADVAINYGLVIEFDDSGKIIRSFHSPTGKVSHLSEAFEHNGYLYLGSWRNKYIGRLKL
ncbi:adipocyte plasma membrane-associated protein [Caerostris extrusa]|uniref:Adipocyte plasma membrane-associated protein n=1 Tax=Caerostris extrusa TaxID=172846 RepID=A0AAV4PPI6_CAEEX|nr:adipocyte plasma membrane-associated protein [Caerostris extrusa]